MAKTDFADQELDDLLGDEPQVGPATAAPDVEPINFQDAELDGLLVDQTPANGQVAAQPTAPERSAFERFGEWARGALDNDVAVGFAEGAGQGVLARAGEWLGQKQADLDFGALPEGTVKSGGGLIDNLPKTGPAQWARGVGRVATGIPAAYWAGPTMGAQAALGGATGASNALSGDEDPYWGTLIGMGTGALGARIGQAPGNVARGLTQATGEAVEQVPAQAMPWLQQAKEAVDGPWLEAPARKIGSLIDEAADPIMRGASQYRPAMESMGREAGRQVAPRVVQAIEPPAAQAGEQFARGAAQYGVQAAEKAGAAPIDSLMKLVMSPRQEIAKAVPGALRSFAGQADKAVAGPLGGLASQVSGQLATPAASKAGAQDVAYAGTPTTAWAVESVLSSGASGLPAADEQRLTEAVMSGDEQRVITTNFLLTQKHPGYAKRMQDEYESLQHGSQ